MACSQGPYTKGHTVLMVISFGFVRFSSLLLLWSILLLALEDTSLDKIPWFTPNPKS